MRAANAEQKREFVSRDTGIDRSEWALTVGFARDLADEDSDDAFLVQRGLDIDEDEPGLGGVYVEIPPQRYAMYGGVARATLSRTSFEIEFSSAGAEAMGGYGSLLARFELDARQFDEVREALRFVFQGCACYIERP